MMKLFLVAASLLAFSSAEDVIALVQLRAKVITSDKKPMWTHFLPSNIASYFIEAVKEGEPKEKDVTGGKLAISLEEKVDGLDQSSAVEEQASDENAGQMADKEMTAGEAVNSFDDAEELPSADQHEHPAAELVRGGETNEAKGNMTRKQKFSHKSDIQRLRGYFTYGRHNDCPMHYVMIRDEEQCTHALEALGLHGFEGRGTWPHLPGGCFKNAAGKVSLNMGKGVGSKGRVPICEWKWGNYFTLGKGNSCPEHYTDIGDEGQCQKAVKALKLQSWRHAGEFQDKPGGCFVDADGEVFLNHGQGKGAPHHAPICEWQWQVPKGQRTEEDSSAVMPRETVFEDFESKDNQVATPNSGKELLRTIEGGDAGREDASADTSEMVRLLDFSQAQLVQNNLGGQGPDSGPEEMRFRNLVRGMNIDLVVTAAEGYTAFKPNRNSILGGNGQINVKSGTTANLRFRFVDQGTDNTHVLPKFYFTFSDIDERHRGSEKETIKVDGYDKYYTNDDLAIVEDGQPIPTFQSSDYGNFEDNNFSPDSPEPAQLSHAVTYLFLNKASFSANFSINSNRDFKKGRNVLFSGISQLVFCQDASTYLDFSKSQVTSNNLGGKGPASGPPELRWSNIASKDGVSLDLVAVVDADSSYIPWNTSQNGLHGDFGHINLFCGPTQPQSQSVLTFTVVTSGTNEPVTLDQFAFVVFDFDSGNHEMQTEFVELAPNAVGFEGGSGYASYILTKTTEVTVTKMPNGKRRFMSTKHGTEADNPKTSQMVSRETADKSAVFSFRHTSAFKMTLGITASGENTGRNFMFSGQDMYLLCD